MGSSYGVYRTLNRIDDILPEKEIGIEELPEYGLVVRRGWRNKKCIHRYPAADHVENRDFIPPCRVTDTLRVEVEEDDRMVTSIHADYKKISIRRYLPFESWSLCRNPMCFRNITLAGNGL